MILGDPVQAGTLTASCIDLDGGYRDDRGQPLGFIRTLDGGWFFGRRPTIEECVATLEVHPGLGRGRSTREQAAQLLRRHLSETPAGRYWLADAGLARRVYGAADAGAALRLLGAGQDGTFRAT